MSFLIFSAGICLIFQSNPREICIVASLSSFLSFAWNISPSTSTTIFSLGIKKSGYQKGLSIERIDVNGNYEPKNCKWIPRSEQALNTRKTVYILHNGEKIPLAKTARELGVSPSLAWHRWKKGMSYEDIFYPGNLLYKK